MGVYADQLASINTQIDRTEFEIDAIEGTKSMTIYVYQEAAGTGPSYTKYARDGQPLVYTHTGTGGIEKMATDWRTANPTATAEDDAVMHGGMFYIWSKVQDSRFETEFKGTELTSLKNFLVYLNKKKDHYQAIVDNGEDASNLHSLEDLADIEASAP
tara:strand:+ start:2907 stop:3380 length:474 start_codon:yes stop_codon:yes gene_type:complete